MKVYFSFSLCLLLRGYIYYFLLCLFVRSSPHLFSLLGFSLQSHGDVVIQFVLHVASQGGKEPARLFHTARVPYLGFIRVTALSPTCQVCLCTLCRTNKANIMNGCCLPLSHYRPVTTFVLILSDRSKPLCLNFFLQNPRPGSIYSFVVPLYRILVSHDTSIHHRFRFSCYSG